MPPRSTEVSLAAFELAVRRLPKKKLRMVGVKTSMPVDTILSPDPHGVMVETPVMSSLVLGTPPWQKTVSLHSWKLVGLFETLQQIRSISEKTEKIWIGCEDNNFVVFFNTTKLSLPILRQL
jgi:hypothetical protein